MQLNIHASSEIRNRDPCLACVAPRSSEVCVCLHRKRLCIYLRNPSALQGKPTTVHADQLQASCDSRAVQSHLLAGIACKLRQERRLI
jgi:hypothetical protein